MVAALSFKKRQQRLENPDFFFYVNLRQCKQFGTFWSYLTCTLIYFCFSIHDRTGQNDIEKYTLTFHLHEFRFLSTLIFQKNENVNKNVAILVFESKLCGDNSLYFKMHTLYIYFEENFWKSYNYNLALYRDKYLKF